MEGIPEEGPDGEFIDPEAANAAPAFTMPGVNMYGVPGGAPPMMK
jgi:hypothetical protein